ncbi:MAG: glycosyltransferase [Saprospiraceae bacterium]|nr:glycosyltransferase [Saprospiraceae bacterium]
MRLLWITPGFAANESDHNCIPPLQALARALARRGVELHIIALEYPFFPPSGQGHSPFGFENLKLYPCNGQNRRWLRWRTQGRAIQQALQLATPRRFDAVHSFWLGPAWILGQQLAATWNTPHWCTLMGQDVLPRNWWYLRRLRPSHAGQLVALSAFQNDCLEKSAGFRAAHTIPWGLEAEAFTGQLPAERPPDILGVGSLIPVKNWPRWLKVLHLLAQQQVPFRAELIGEGPERRRLQVLIEKYGLEKQVRLPGNLPRPEVLERMRNSRVLLHTAQYESFGMVLLEAAASGCRVVSTPVGIAPELGRCAATDPALVEELAQALLPASPAPSPLPSRFFLEEIARQYLSLYAP